MAEHIFTFSADEVRHPDRYPAEWLAFEKKFDQIQADANHRVRSRTAWLDDAGESIRDEPAERCRFCRGDETAHACDCI